MKPGLIKGQLVKWNDERGFGFIQPSEGGETVFLHISAVKTTGRRPQVGDTIFYKQTTAADGKTRAADALIQGVVSRSASTQSRKAGMAKKQPESFSLGSLKALLGLGISVFAGMFYLQSSVRSVFRSRPAPPPAAGAMQPTPAIATLPSGCLVKGNISISSGRRWYHVPGMEDYEGTVINESHGERWFCSEAEAQAAGWVRAPR